MAFGFCTLFGHRRDGKSVWHDNLDFRAPCKRCGAPMIKDPIRGRWRAFNRERDFEIARRARPHSR